MKLLDTKSFSWFEFWVGSIGMTVCASTWLTNVPNFIFSCYLIRQLSAASGACSVFTTLLRGWSTEVTAKFLAATTVCVALALNWCLSFATGKDSFSWACCHHGQAISHLYRRSAMAKELICYCYLSLRL